MHDAIFFVGLLVVVLLAYMAWRLRGISWRAYFSTKDGRGILRGIVIAPAAILIIAGVLALVPSCAQAQSGTWFNDASVFVGIDVTKTISPQCGPNRVDERGTSNLGARLNVWQSDSRRIRVNTKYTHHSCVLGVDDRHYDAIGVELEWVVWSR